MLSDVTCSFCDVM